MIELLLEEYEIDHMIFALNTVREIIYKEDSEYWKASKRIVGYIEHMKKKKSSSAVG